MEKQVAESDSPMPVRPVADEGDAKAFIPYPDVGENFQNVPIHVRPEVYYYAPRMGFLPNVVKLYLHTPWIAEPLIRLNNAIMRDERNALSEQFKYRLAIVASRDNECTYCTAHNAGTLKQRFGYEDDDVTSVLSLNKPQNEQEAAAFEFVHQASLDPAGVTDEQRARLAEHFTPSQVMEIVQVVGFWKMYNTMHLAMDVPLEDPMLEYSDWVNVQPQG